MRVHAAENDLGMLVFLTTVFVHVFCTACSLGPHYAMKAGVILMQLKSSTTMNNSVSGPLSL